MRTSFYIAICLTKRPNKMSELEIIKGLLLMLAEEEIDVMALSKRIGFKNYKKFDKALNEAIDLVEKEK